MPGLVRALPRQRRLAPTARHRTALQSTLADELRIERLLAAERTAKLQAREVAEESLLDLVADGETAPNKIRKRLAAIAHSRQ